MNIIMNERERAEDFLRTMKFGPNPYHDISIVAKYYYYIENRSKKNIAHLLEILVSRCDQTANMNIWGKRIDRIISSLGKYKLLEINSIPITYAEIEIIKQLKSVQLQRLLFTLIFLAKFSNEASYLKVNRVNRDDSEIFRMANVATSIQRKGLMLKQLSDDGLISFGKRIDDMNITVDCLKYNSDPCLWISDARNVGNQYMMYAGMPYIACEECGLVIKRVGRRQKYCRECAAERNIEKTKASIAMKKLMS